MSNHTINSWKKYCLYRKNAIEDLRKRAVSNADKKAIPKDLIDETGTEVTGETLHILQQVDFKYTNPQQIDAQQPTSPQTLPQSTISPPPIPQQTTSHQTIPQSTTFQQAAPGSTFPQRATSQPSITQRVTPQSTTPQQATLQPVDLQPAMARHKSQPLQPPYEKVAETGPVLVKTEPLDEDQLDFAFATQVLSGWKPHEESDAELWKRMETIVRSLISPLGLQTVNGCF
jgi:hypothetical protein